MRKRLQFIHHSCIKWVGQSAHSDGAQLPADAYKAGSALMALLSVALNRLPFAVVRSLGCTLVLVIALAGEASAADLTVILDQAEVVTLPDRVATIVVGNPMIADVSLQPGGLMVVTGKSYGVTNLMVLDRAGHKLMDKLIEVQGPDVEPGVVVMYRGVERETYGCTPICERRITLGDSNVVFDAGIAQSTNRNGLVQGPGPAAAK